MMTAVVKGKTIAEAEGLFGAFHKMVTADPSNASDSPAVGKLAAFAGVREFPVRVKCATLPWHTLYAALEGGGQVASTE
jgi:nitrogen fixation NifU-like protein